MIAWFARNAVAANLLMLVILFMGFRALGGDIPLESFPSFDIDTVSVSMVYRGATPEEVEEGVVFRIEEAIADLQGIDKIRATAGQGSATVLVELDDDADPRAMLDDIKNRVDAIPSFPAETERPVYSLQQFKREVITVVISGDLPERDLRALGERARDQIEQLPGITQVELQAVRSFEISIEVSEEALDRYGLTFDAIVQAVRRSSVDLPAGSIKSRGGEILLRTKAQAYDRQDFSRIIVQRREDGSQLLLSDVATVVDGFEENPLYAQFDGDKAVLVKVQRVGRQSVIEIADTVRDWIDAQQSTMPVGVKLRYWDDNSRSVRLRLSTLLDSAWLGGLCIFIVLSLFLRMTVALWVCVGIPISFMGALALMPVLGVTVNLVSLFAFILVLGIVVDDAIVTGENIYRHLKRGGNAVENTVNGTLEIAMPVTFGVLTTMVAFTPLLLIEGARGQVFAQIALIVIPVLCFSLVESKLILPAHMRHVRASAGAHANILLRIQQYVAGGLERFVERVYSPFLERTLNARYVALAVFVGIALIMAAVVASGRVGFAFFPRIQSDTARVNLTMPEGTPVEITTRHIERIARIAADMQAQYREPNGEPVIQHIMMGVGWAGRSARSGSPEIGQVVMELVPSEERASTTSTREIVAELRRRVGGVPGARELNYRAEIGRAGEPIAIQLAGQDFARMAQVAALIKERLAGYPGVFDIRDSFQEGKPEIKLSLLPEAEMLGLSTRDLGQQVRQAFFGAEAQRIQRGRDDVRVMVRYPEAQRDSVASLQRMRIRTPDGAQVPFSSAASVETGLGYASIERIDRQRIVNVSADMDKAAGNTNRIVADLTDYLDEALVAYPDISYRLEGELREQEESFASSRTGMWFVLFAVYAMLAIPFRSYVQPLIVMVAIPFGIVGAVLGHMLLGFNMSIMSIFGMLALAGVVVNDSLVLVDWINRRRREGMALIEAVQAAGAARFRAIILTSLTTFSGLMPLMSETSIQAQFLIPMAISLAWGILFATVITLLLVPCCYLALEDLRSLFSNSDAVNEGQPAGTETSSQVS